MSSIQEKVSIAFTCRRVLQGLKEKIRDLPPECKTEDSNELLELMSDVGAIVGDDTVVEAVRHCDTDRVRLLVHEKEFRSHLNIPPMKHEIKEEVNDYDWQNVNSEGQLDGRLSSASGNSDSDEDLASNGGDDLNESILDVNEECDPSVMATQPVSEIPASSDQTADSQQTLPPANLPTNMPVYGNGNNDENLASDDDDLNRSMIDVKEEHAPHAVAIDPVFALEAVERAAVSNGSAGSQASLPPYTPTANQPLSENCNSEEISPANDEVDLDKSMLEVKKEPFDHDVATSIPVVKREAFSIGSLESDRTLPPANRLTDVPQMTKTTSLATTVDLFSQEDCAPHPVPSQEASISQHDANIVDDLLDSLDESVHVDHINDIRQHKVVYKSPCYFEVLSCEESQSVYYVMPGINYCYCDRFQTDVLGSHEEFTCVHVMATWMAEALGAGRIAPTSAEKLATIVKLLEDRTMDYH